MSNPTNTLPTPSTATTPMTPKTKTVLIPSWHPPYEEPLQLQFPTHLDNSARRHELGRGDDQSLGHKRRKMKHDFKESRKRYGFAATIALVEASTVAARISGLRPMPVTPPFFAVTLWGDDWGGDIEVVYREAMKAIEGSFGTESSGVIIRFFLEELDTDF